MDGEGFTELRRAEGEKTRKYRYILCEHEEPSDLRAQNRNDRAPSLERARLEKQL